MFDSQKINLKPAVKPTLRSHNVEELDFAVYNAVMIDGRTFNDFSKPGIILRYKP